MRGNLFPLPGDNQRANSAHSHENEPGDILFRRRAQKRNLGHILQFRQNAQSIARMENGLTSSQRNPDFRFNVGDEIVPTLHGRQPPQRHPDQGRSLSQRQRDDARPLPQFQNAAHGAIGQHASNSPCRFDIGVDHPVDAKGRAAAVCELVRIFAGRVFRHRIVGVIPHTGDLQDFRVDCIGQGAGDHIDLVAFSHGNQGIRRGKSFPFQNI